MKSFAPLLLVLLFFLTGTAMTGAPQQSIKVNPDGVNVNASGAEA